MVSRPADSASAVSASLTLVVGGLVADRELDLDVVAAERVDQPGQFARCRIGPVRSQRRRDRALAAAGEDHPVPVVRVGERGLVIDRQALLAAGQLRGADDLAEPPVPFRVTGEDEQMPAHRIGNARPRRPGSR